MCAKKLNALPYRRLRTMANGIWDEVRKEFYPFRVKSSTVAAKSGFLYYVKSCGMKVNVTGITAAGYGVWQITSFGTTYSIGVSSPQMTQATDYFAETQNFEVSVLCDVKTAITLATSNVTATGFVIIAEVPDDPAGGPVMIE